MPFVYVRLRVGSGFVDATGRAAVTRLHLTPLAEMRNGPTVLRERVTLALDEDATTVRTVAATTSPGTLPAPSFGQSHGYWIEVEAAGKVVRRFRAQVPHDAGAVVDLESLVVLDDAPFFSTVQPIPGPPGPQGPQGPPGADGDGAGVAQSYVDAADTALDARLDTVEAALPGKVDETASTGLTLTSGAALAPAGATRTDMGYGSGSPGPRMELYRADHPTRPGEYVFLFGGATDAGEVTYIHHDAAENYPTVFSIGPFGASAEGNRIREVGAPTAGTDAVNRIYSDAGDAALDARLDTVEAAIGTPLPRAKLWDSTRNTPQALTSFDETDFDLDTVEFNVGLDVTTNPGKVRIPTGQGGTYVVTASQWFEAGDLGARIGIVKVNGNNTFEFGVPFTGDGRPCGVSTVVLNAGDVVSLGCYVTGSGVTIRSYREQDMSMSLVKVA